MKVTYGPKESSEDEKTEGSVQWNDLHQQGTTETTDHQSLPTQIFTAGEMRGKMTYQFFLIKKKRTCTLQNQEGNREAFWFGIHCTTKHQHMQSFTSVIHYKPQQRRAWFVSYSQQWRGVEYWSSSSLHCIRRWLEAQCWVIDQSMTTPDWMYWYKNSFFYSTVVILLILRCWIPWVWRCSDAAVQVSESGARAQLGQYFLPALRLVLFTWMRHKFWKKNQIINRARWWNSKSVVRLVA